MIASATQPSAAWSARQNREVACRHRVGVYLAGHCAHNRVRNPSPRLAGSASDLPHPGVRRGEAQRRACTPSGAPWRGWPVSIAQVTVHPVVLQNASYRLLCVALDPSGRLLCASVPPDGFPVSTYPATIRRTRPDPASTRVRRLTPSTGPWEDSCGYQDRRDRLRSRAARMSPRCHPAGSKRFARRGGCSRVGLHKLRWATAQPNPAAGARHPKRGLGE